MTFTEVVFEVADGRYPLCRMTQHPSASTAVVRVLDDGRGSGRFRTLVTVHGARAELARLPDDLRAYRAGGVVDVLREADGLLTLRTTAAASDAGQAPVRLLDVLRVIDDFGSDVLWDPFVVRGGVIRARVLVPRRIETQRALLSLQDVQRSSGFAGFRVVRVGAVHPARHVDLRRRMLPPEQEDLLRLATALGYYTTPKRATLETIARRVGLSVSPIHKRLKSIEEALVTAHVDPAHGPHRLRHRHPRKPCDAEGVCPAEVWVRVRWAGSGIARFAAATRGARVMLQPLDVDPKTRMAGLLVIALAPDGTHDELLGMLRARGDVQEVEVVEQARGHLVARLAVALGEGDASAFPWWSRTWGDDGLLHPLVFEEDGVALRFLVTRPLHAGALHERLDRCAHDAGWSGYEVLAVRDPDDAALPLARPDPPTPRQEEVMKIAHALGYYRTPRACTLEHLASTLGVSANAIHKNLSSAEAKVVTTYLAAGM